MKPAGADRVRELNEDMAGNIGRGRRIQPLKAAAPKRLSAKEKGRGAAAFLWRWMVLARSTPKGGGLGGANAQGEHFVSTDPRDTLPALCFNRVSWSAEMVSS